MRSVRIVCVVIVGVLSFGAGCVSAAAQEAATLYSAQGVVERRDDGAPEWTRLEIGQTINDRAAVRTGPGSRAALVLADGLMVRLNQNSLFQVTLDGGGAPSAAELNRGTAHFFSRKEREFPTIKTQLVSASIRGTEFTVTAEPQRGEIAVLAGLVHAENTFGAVELRGGERATVVPGAAPQKAIMVNPTDAVQWALYYPVTVSVDDLPEFAAASGDIARGVSALRGGDAAGALEAFRVGGALAALGRGLALYQLGDVAGAGRALEEAAPSPSRELIKAALFLGSGQVTEAEALHQRAAGAISALPPGTAAPLQALLLSQQAIIAVTQNKMAEAREKAAAAAAAAETSVSAACALSYVDQAAGDIDGAAAVVRTALARSPEEPALLLRGAELNLSQGESKDAALAAAAVTERMPQNGYAYTVRGFAELARLDVDGARASFERAIALGGGDGLPFLGLGLTQVRTGDLESGRRSIQQAAHLEPARSLYRSYLGKALFEEEREALSGEEYDRAIALDPHDPTPYLYRTYLHLSRNDPVAALDDIEASIKLNDNRAVYRSRLLLDQDASVRSSSLADVYTTLGFSEIARIEALRSITRDYANYSAHLELSQVYENTEDYFQASISEFFIARLLSPVNFNLVRPSQAGGISANEYTAVFDRDQNRTSLEFDGRTKDRFAAPGLLTSGTAGRWGYALSYSPTYADGYRDNDSLNEHATYGSLQYQLSPETSLLLDGNLETFDNGDTAIGYDPYDNDPDEGSSFDDFTVRAGANHRFGPGSQLIGQVVGSHSNFRLADETFDRTILAYLTAGGVVLDGARIDTFVDERARFLSNNIRGDIQHIYTSAEFSNVLGGGAFNGSQNQDETAEVVTPVQIAGLDFGSSAENTEASRRIYNYTTFHLAPWLDLQGGVSYTHLHIGGGPLNVPFDESVATEEHWDPKVGIVASPTDSTTVRAAFFETTGSAAIRELELIEPTLVSGFNQSFFDIVPGTSSRSLAFGVDQKLPSRTYIGAELTKRAVSRNFPFTASQLFFDVTANGAMTTDIFLQPNDAHIDDHQVRGYLYQVLGMSATATAEYLGQIEEDNLLGSEVRTDRVRLGLNYFSPSGWFTFGRGTWRNQDLEDVNTITNGDETVEEDFWIVDLGLGYRFPKRHGRIALTLNNVFDTEFEYYPTGIEPPVLPGIGGVVSFSYNF